MDMRRRSTFCSRASASKRSSGPSKPSRLTISSPSPGAMTSGPAALKPSGSAGLLGWSIALGFTEGGAEPLQDLPALSPCGQQRRKSFGCVGQPGFAGGRMVAAQPFAAGLEAALAGLAQGPGATHDIHHLVPPAVAVQRQVAAGGQRPLGALAQGTAQGL